MLTIPLASEGAGIGHGVLAMHGGTGSGGEQEIPLGAMIFGSDLEDPPLGKMGAGPGLDSHRGDLTTSQRAVERKFHFERHYMGLTTVAISAS